MYYYMATNRSVVDTRRGTYYELGLCSGVVDAAHRAVACLLTFDTRTTEAANDLEDPSKVYTRNCQLTPVTVSEISTPTGKGEAVTKAELRKQHHVARKSLYRYTLFVATAYASSPSRL